MNPPTSSKSKSMADGPHVPRQTEGSESGVLLFIADADADSEEKVALLSEVSGDKVPDNEPELEENARLVGDHKDGTCSGQRERRKSAVSRRESID